MAILTQGELFRMPLQSSEVGGHELSVPPLEIRYRELLKDSDDGRSGISGVLPQCELPVIDLRGLRSESRVERTNCADRIARAATELGFFEIINHGIPGEVIEELQVQQTRLFELPFELKQESSTRLKSCVDCYKWGTPSASTLEHLCWMEAFHVPLRAKSTASADQNPEGFRGLRMAIQQYGEAVGTLAHQLAGILAENVGRDPSYFSRHCTDETSFLRLNRYPACPVPSEVLGLVSHTDSDFLTVLYQDAVEGLQIMRDGEWFSVKPKPDTLLVNVGDLFQAWSNDVYKSIKHRAVVNSRRQRTSVAYFLCPSYDTVIDNPGDASNPPRYRDFTFSEFRAQVAEDVRYTGNKIGLPKFLI